jgi:exonuclease SbcC
MANILEFLRSILTTEDANTAFRDAPRDHLVASGFADLTGEDVTTALAALGPSLAPDVAAALADLEAGGLAASARPADGEDELDAAARVLQQAVEAVPAPAPAAGKRRSSGARRTKQAAGADVAPEAAPSTAPPPPDLAALPTVVELREALDAAAARATADAQALAERIATLFTELDAEIAEMRSTATDEIARWRQEAADDREAARAALASIDADADVLREKAAASAEKLVADARAAAERGEQELAARWAELERAEARHQERVANIDSLFKSVLADDPAASAESAV